MISTEQLIAELKRCGVKEWEVCFSGGCDVLAENRGHYIQKHPGPQYREIKLKGYVVPEEEPLGVA